MNLTENRNEKLLAYYLGLLDGKDRHDMEELLLSNPAMLMDFIALKRSFEIEGEIDSEGSSELAHMRVPSPAARARLRRAVEEKFVLGKFGTEKIGNSNVFVFQLRWQVRRWIPATVAAMLLVIAGGYSLYSKTRHQAVEPEPVANRVSGGVDSAGDGAVSLSFL